MKILLATDGSDYAKEAAAQCGEFAAGCEKPIVKIITIADYSADVASEPFMSSKEFVEAVEEEMRKKSQEILSEAEKIVRYKNDSVEIYKEMYVGSAKQIIVDEAANWEADLIVMGSHGYGFFKRAFLGSVSDAVLHHASCSVLIVRKSE